MCSLPSEPIQAMQQSMLVQTTYHQRINRNFKQDCELSFEIEIKSDTCQISISNLTPKNDHFAFGKYSVFFLR